MRLSEGGQRLRVRVRLRLRVRVRVKVRVEVWHGDVAIAFS